MRWEVLLSFLSAALVVQLVPGPGMLFILASGVAGGPRAGVAAALGAASGIVVHTVAAALGLAALFAHAPAAYDALRIAGALYLFWLAIGHFRTGAGELEAGGRGGRSARTVFIRALLNNLANPTVILFYLAFLPQFVAPGAGSATVQLLVLGFLFLSSASSSTSCWACAPGGSVTRCGPGRRSAVRSSASQGRSWARSGCAC